MCVCVSPQLEQERSSAVEAVEVARCGLEEELKRCRDRLRAVQVERNLLLVSLLVTFCV